MVDRALTKIRCERKIASNNIQWLLRDIATKEAKAADVDAANLGFESSKNFGNQDDFEYRGADSDSDRTSAPAATSSAAAPAPAFQFGAPAPAVSEPLTPAAPLVLAAASTSSAAFAFGASQSSAAVASNTFASPFAPAAASSAAAPAPAFQLGDVSFTRTPSVGAKSTPATALGCKHGTDSSDDGASNSVWPIGKFVRKDSEVGGGGRKQQNFVGATCCFFLAPHPSQH